MAGQKPRRVLIMTTIGKQLASRMMRASLAEKELYWELTLDPGAIRQSVLAVLIVAVAWGIGSAVDYLLDGDTGGAIVGFLVTGLWALFCSGSRSAHRHT